MARFLFFALPALLALVAGANFGLAALGWAPPSGLPARAILGGWLLEAVGLTALFLLIQARGLARWAAGLGTAWTAWLFRGPILVVTVAGASRVPPATWWRLALAWFALYTLCGLALAALAEDAPDDPPREAPPGPSEWPS